MSVHLAFAMLERKPKAERPAEYHDPEHASSRESKTRHEARYRAAISLLHGEPLPPGVVLDCACGVGYGTAMLALAFPDRAVIGVDRNVAAIRTARTRYREKNTEFYALHIRQAGAWLRGLVPVAAVVCIETLEHLSQDLQRLWLHRAGSALSSNGGILVIMCPIGKGRKKPVNPWHLHEPSLEELCDHLMDAGGEVTTYPPERYHSTAGVEAWQATVVLRKP